MPHNRHDWLRRIKAIEREHSSTRLALDRLLEEARRDPTILTGDLKFHDIVVASDRLEGTYIIRLFAEFETGLRRSGRRSEGPSHRADARLAGRHRRQATGPDQRASRGS